MIEILKAILFGIVEGITEWLPISSTGHMILIDEFITLGVTEEFRNLFLVVIQLGAILAVPVLFFDKLVPTPKKGREENMKILSLWLKVIVGVLPCAVIGILFEDIIDGYLLNFVVVAVALVVYGIAFILIERFNKDKTPRINDVYSLGYRDALVIGAYQLLALVPGTSRSGSTILGGMLSGVSRTAASEFSFFMALPVMLGASFLKLLKFIISYFDTSDTTVYIPEGEEFAYITYLLVGMIVAFVVSLFVIRFLMSFVKKNSFASFGIYRIALGALVLLYFILKVTSVIA
ncbi:MAG: undecaprenyl-diphosphate phosphatase [Clostridia bacterium]|nr:undecaprenyl-diphosphate phosphatase [Clostridia bacterium]